MTRWATAMVLVASAGLVAACDSSGGEVTSPGAQESPTPTSDEDAFRPTENPEATVSPPSPLEEPAGDAEELSGEHFTLQVPADYEEQVITTSQGQDMTIFKHPATTEAAPTQVALVAEPEPNAGVMEQSASLEAQKAASDFSRSVVEWPGAQQAVFLAFTDPGAGGDDQQTWQIMAQVDDELIVNVVATAPASEFDSSGVGEVLRTFRPTS